MKEDSSWNDIKDSLNSVMPENTKLEDSQQNDVMNFVNAFGKLKFDDNKIKLSKNLLESAKDNLSCYNNLFANKRYASAIFNLVLANEKISKAYGLSFFGVEEKELFKISHDSPITFKILMEKEPYKSYLEILKVSQPNVINKNPKEIEDLINDKKKVEEILKSNEDEINVLIDAYEKVDNVFNEETQNKIKEVVNNVFSLFPQQHQSLKGNLDFSTLPKLVGSFTKLACVSFITFPHYFTSNYPDSDKINYLQYNEELGIVKTSSRIYAILISALENLESYINKLNITEDKTKKEQEQ